MGLLPKLGRAGVSQVYHADWRNGDTWPGALLCRASVDISAEAAQTRNRTRGQGVSFRLQIKNRAASDAEVSWEYSQGRKEVLETGSCSARPRGEQYP